MSKSCRNCKCEAGVLCATAQDIENFVDSMDSNYDIKFDKHELWQRAGEQCPDYKN